MRDRARCVRRCRAGCVRTARRTGAALGLGHLCTPPWRARRATKARRGRVAAPSGLAPACALHQAQRQPFFCVRGPSRSAPLRRRLPLARGGMVLETRIWGCRAPPWPCPDGPGALVLPAFGVLWAPPLRRARAPHPPRPCAKTHAVSRHRNAHARPHLGRGPSQEARRALGRGVRRAPQLADALADGAPAQGPRHRGRWRVRHVLDAPARPRSAQGAAELLVQSAVRGSSRDATKSGPERPSRGSVPRWCPRSVGVGSGGLVDEAGGECLPAPLVRDTALM